MVKIGIFGGTGVYDPGLLKDAKKIEVKTPFGGPSDLVTTGKYEDVDIVVIHRHGSNHTINPSNVNYRANIDAMKQLGVTHIIATTAVGSLKEEFKPGELVFVDQFFDRTQKRVQTFYEKDRVCHISMAEPFCNNLRKLLSETASELKLPYHDKGSVVTIEGPRFSTKAESSFFRTLNLDIINMTTVPEVILAREAEICYATIATVTDYDCWKDSVVNTAEIIRVIKENSEKVKSLITSVIPKIKDDPCSCREALKSAFI